MTSLTINNYKITDASDTGKKITANFEKDLANKPNLFGINSVVSIGDCTSSGETCEKLNACCYKYTLDTEGVKFNITGPNNADIKQNNLVFNLTTSNFPSYDPDGSKSIVGTSISILVQNALGHLMSLTSPENGTFKQDGKPLAHGNQFSSGSNLTNNSLNIPNFFANPHNMNTISI